MAGAGYKLFNTGDVLTAAQVNTYLQEQTVMVFADAAARTAALSGVLAEGMLSYLKDTNAVEKYDGSSWSAIGGGGLTSPLTTKGDIWVYGTGDTRLPVGTNGHTLVADSTETTGLKWAAPAGGGKVLQVVSVTYDTQTTLSNVDWTDTGLSASITPTAATSKVLVIITQPLYIYRNGNFAGIGVRVRRGSTTITGGENDYISHYIGLSSNTNTLEFSSNYAVHYLDNPSTTSATTYKTQVKSNNQSTINCVAQLNAGSAGMDATITLMEIGA